jgi:macrolide transport system ATP-binding/permease protein
VQALFSFGQQFPMAYKHDGWGGAKWLLFLGDRIGGRVALCADDRLVEGEARMASPFQDLRYALRQLGKSPGFSLVAILMLALGIGTNSAIFGFVDAWLLKPLPVADSERLVRIYARGPAGHYGAGFSYPEFELLRDHNSSFADLSVEAPIAQLHLVSGGDSEEVRGEFVSGNYFSLLGIRPSLGREFLADEDAAPGRDAVAVISDGLWLGEFNRDPGVLGREIHINGVGFKVIGVAPPKFHGALKGSPVAIWMPAMMLGAVGYGCGEGGAYDCSLFQSIIGKLKVSQTAARAQAEVGNIMVWSATDWPERPSRRQVVVTSANLESPDDQADHLRPMYLLMAVTAALLLIACANLAGLLLSRGVVRRREIAVRLSIGAGRARIIRQLLTESVLLAGIGGVAGLAVTFAVGQFLLKFYSVDSEGFHHFYDLSIDWRILAYSIAVSLITGVVFGLVPAIRASRQNLVVELKEGGTREQHRKAWLRQTLIVGQLALSMLLVISAGLLLRSAAAVRQGTNFNPEHVLVLRLRPELIRYTQPQIESFVHRVGQRLSMIASVSSFAYMQGGEGLVWEWSSGRDAQLGLSSLAPAARGALVVRKQDVGPSFFRTLRIPLLEGREFGEQDRQGSPPVAIVNEALAHRLVSIGSAVGRTLWVDGRPFQIVGVSANLQPESSLRAPAPHLYLCYWQSNATREGDIRFAIRVVGQPEAALRGIRRLIQSVDPNVPVGEDMPMSEQVRLQYAPVILAQNIMSFCGTLALFLCAIGLYSSVAFAVRSRTREIGIRMALGAGRADVLGLVLGQGAKLTLIGVLAGSVATTVSTRLLASFLFGVKAIDPATYIAVAILLFLVALVACYLPARRAMLVEPVEALHTE